MDFNVLYFEQNNNNSKIMYINEYCSAKFYCDYDYYVEYKFVKLGMELQSSSAEQLFVYYAGICSELVF